MVPLPATTVESATALWLLPPSNLSTAVCVSGPTLRSAQPPPMIYPFSILSSRPRQRFRRVASLISYIAILSAVIVDCPWSSSYRFNISVSSEVIEQVWAVDMDNLIEANVHMVMNSSILVTFSSQPEACRIFEILSDIEQQTCPLVIELLLDIFTNLWKSDYEGFWSMTSMMTQFNCNHS